VFNFSNGIYFVYCFLYYICGKKPIKLVFGAPYAADHYCSKYDLMFKDLVEKQTKGQIIVDFYPALQLGTVPEELQAIKMGSQQMFATSPGNIVTFLPKMATFDLPYIYRDQDHHKKVAKNFATLIDQDEFVAKLGARVLGYYIDAPRNLTSNVPELLVPGIAACIFYPDIPIQMMSSRLANSFLSSSLLAVPLFVFAAQILTDIEVADNIFSFINKVVGHVRGGLAHVNVVASVIFAGMSGLAVADAAGLGKVEIEAMNKQGYPKSFAAAVTAASATIGPIIPPSVPLIILGSIGGVSIGKLMIGGFVPGIIMAIVMMILISLIARRRGFPKTKFEGFGVLWKNAVKAFPGLMAPIILIGGMVSGFFTPTEAAAVAVVYAIMVGFMLKTLTLKGLLHSFRRAALDSAVILVCFIGASLIGLLVLRLHVADAAIKFMTGFTDSPVVLLMVINIFLLIVGCLLDSTCSIILFTPILLPLTKAFGINEIHFGVVMILNLMIGLLTPPMGSILLQLQYRLELRRRSFWIWPPALSLSAK
jgi:tripartite ATP-independent transporter DctM subunit